MSGSRGAVIEQEPAASVGRCPSRGRHDAEPPEDDRVPPAQHGRQLADPAVAKQQECDRIRRDVAVGLLSYGGDDRPAVVDGQAVTGTAAPGPYPEGREMLDSVRAAVAREHPVKADAGAGEGPFDGVFAPLL